MSDYSILLAATITGAILGLLHTLAVGWAVRKERERIIKLIEKATGNHEGKYIVSKEQITDICLEVLKKKRK